MTSPTPRDPDFAAKVAESFAGMAFMAGIGARLVHVAPGTCAVALDFRPDLCQQRGFLHGGVTIALADSASGLAAFSLMPKGASPLTVEIKANLLAPAQGSRFVAEARVLKPGRTLHVVYAEVFAETAAKRVTVATTLGTFMCLENTPDRPAAA